MRHACRAAKPAGAVCSLAQGPNRTGRRQARYRSRAQHGSRNERMSTLPRYTTTEPFKLERNASGRLVFTKANGETYVAVDPVRPFPLSDPDCFISLVDSRSHELLCVNDLADLSLEIANFIRQELAQREFLPRIERIVRVKQHKDPHEWEVITDRGPAEFLFHDDDIRRLSPTRAILVDMHGVRFYIPDSRQLDAKSRRILSQYL